MERAERDCKRYDRWHVHPTLGCFGNGPQLKYVKRKDLHAASLQVCNNNSKSSVYRDRLWVIPSTLSSPEARGPLSQGN